MATIETLDDLSGDTAIRVQLRFCGSTEYGNQAYREDATYISRSGEGEDARITFESHAGSPVGSYRWEAYRYEDDWAYGTSAEPLRLVNVYV